MLYVSSKVMQRYEINLKGPPNKPLNSQKQHVLTQNLVYPNLFFTSPSFFPQSSLSFQNKVITLHPHSRKESLHRRIFWQNA